MSTSLKLAVALLLALASLPFAHSTSFAQHCANRGHGGHVARPISFGDDYEYEDDEDYEDEEDYEDDDYEDDDEDYEGEYEDEADYGAMEEYDDSMDHYRGERTVVRGEEQGDFFFGNRRGHGHSQGRAPVLPEWMVGKWRVQASSPVPGAPMVDFLFSAQGTVRKVSTTITNPPTVQNGASQQASWRSGQLTIGANAYRVATSGTRMTLSNREGRTLTLVRVQDRMVGSSRTGTSRP